MKVLIWKSFFDFNEKFLPCSGVFNHGFGDFLILMRVILVVCALLSLTCVKPWQFPLAPLCDAGRWICHSVMAKVYSDQNLADKVQQHNIINYRVHVLCVGTLPFAVSEQPTLSRKVMISFLFLVHHQLTHCQAYIVTLDYRTVISWNQVSL